MSSYLAILPARAEQTCCLAVDSFATAIAAVRIPIVIAAVG